MTFDDSDICYVNKIDVFYSSFELVFTNGTTFPKKCFSRTFKLRAKKDVQLIIDDTYFCFVSTIDVFKVFLCEFSLMEQIFPMKIFSRTCTLRGKK